MLPPQAHRAEQSRLPAAFGADDEKFNGETSCLDASLWAPVLKKMYRALNPPPRCAWGFPRSACMTLMCLQDHNVRRPHERRAADCAQFSTMGRTGRSIGVRGSSNSWERIESIIPHIGSCSGSLPSVVMHITSTYRARGGRTWRSSTLIVQDDHCASWPGSVQRLQFFASVSSRL